MEEGDCRYWRLEVKEKKPCADKSHGTNRPRCASLHLISAFVSLYLCLYLCVYVQVLFCLCARVYCSDCLYMFHSVRMSVCICAAMSLSVCEQVPLCIRLCLFRSSF